MNNIIRILTLRNNIEASIIDQVLNDKNIPHNLKSLSDPAYNGIFQVQHGWGYLEAPEEYKEEIIAIYNEAFEDK